MYGNPRKGNSSHLSANIFKEFIELMVQQILCTILEELRESILNKFNKCRLHSRHLSHRTTDIYCPIH